MKKIIGIVLSFVLIVMLFISGISVAFGQKNVEYREIVKRDTILATGYVHVDEYVTKSGNNSFKAKWCGKAINISKKVAEDILNGSDAYVIVCRYSNGEVIRSKVITLYND